MILMDIITISADSDDREEGEIVDDDFEDISDTSIVEVFPGKSFSTKDHLRALSLSSVSEDDASIRKNKRRRKPLHKRNTKHRKHMLSDSESEDDIDLKRLQKQLKVAVAVEKVEDTHQNSLEARLKRMNTVDVLSDSSISKIEPEPSKTDTKSVDSISDKEQDYELMELRVEALRTALVNKFQYKKKRKINQCNTFIDDNDFLSDISLKSETDNKENDTSNKNQCIEKDTEEALNSAEHDEDEDVLRAILLASMSKRIIATDNLPEQEEVKKIPEPVNNTKNSFSNMNKKSDELKHIKLPAVKPLIITINGDSSTDEDDTSKIKNKNVTEQFTGNEMIPKSLPVNALCTKSNIDIQSTVEKFLKEQREKIESKQLETPPAKKANSTLAKSAVKLLSKDKQIEYQKLLIRLKNAEKKAPVRKKLNQLIIDNTPKSKATQNPIKSKTATQHTPVSKKSEKSQSDVKKELVLLNQTLGHIRIKRNGRLQIQEKYKDLRPFVKKLIDINEERKKHDKKIRELSEQLTAAKKQLVLSHQEFRTKVNDLVNEKQLIDQRQKIVPENHKETEETIQLTNVSKNITNDLKTSNNHTTDISSNSKPHRSDSNKDVALNSNVSGVSPKNDVAPKIDPSPKIAVSSESNVSPKSNSGHKNVGPESNVGPKSNAAPKNNVGSKSNVGPKSDIGPKNNNQVPANKEEASRSTDLIIDPTHIGDPNDIHLVLNKEKKVDVALIEYISPLDNKRTESLDPLGILCPYEVNGNCRDKDCAFKHLSAIMNLTTEGLNTISENGNIKDKSKILKNALNSDLKEIGASVLANLLTKNVIPKVVLQIQKVRNISAPKANEDSQAAPRLLKLILTDGQTTVQALELSSISISRSHTPPGSKILIDGAKLCSGYLLLNSKCCSVLGGKVEHLYERWELAKSINNSRQSNSTDGAPQWVNFGSKIQSNNKSNDLKSVESNENSVTKEHLEFEQQRQGAIAEASSGAIKKVFGGKVKQLAPPVEPNPQRRNFDNNKAKPRGKFAAREDKDDVIISKPLDKVSLFDFLETKLPLDTKNDIINANKNSSYTEKNVKYDSYKTNTYKQNNSFKREQYPSKDDFNFPLNNSSQNRVKPNTNFKKDYQQNEFVPKSQTPRFEQNNRGKNDYQRKQGQNNDFLTNQNGFTSEAKPNNAYNSGRVEEDKKRQQNQQNNAQNNVQTNFSLKKNYNSRDSQMNALRNSQPNNNYQGQRNNVEINNLVQNVSNLPEAKPNSAYNSSRFEEDRKSQQNNGQNNSEQTNFSLKKGYNSRESQMNALRNSQPNNNYQGHKNNAEMNDLAQNVDKGQTNSSFKKGYNSREIQINTSRNSQPNNNYQGHKSNAEINDLVQNVDRMTINSLPNNSQFASKMLKQALNIESPRSQNQNVQPNQPFFVGCEVAAKYWEDGKVYNATVTAITEKTLVVKFKGYGNIEEVLKTDCTLVPGRNYNRYDPNRTYSGTREYRGNRTNH